MAKSIFQTSPLDAATADIEKQNAAIAAVEGPDLPELSLPPLPAPSTQPRLPGRGAARAVPIPSALKPVFEAAAVRHNVPVNVLMALAEQESSYNPAAVGIPTQWGRAKGIMQYLDSTAGRLGINPFDTNASIDAAARQIRERLNKGYSMADAVKEHFAGTDRSKWGPKTGAYGQEVLARAQRIKVALAPEYARRAGTPQGESAAMRRIMGAPIPRSVEEARKRDLPAKPKSGGSAALDLAADTGNSLLLGWNSATEGLAELINRIPVVGPAIVRANARADEWLNGPHRKGVFADKRENIEADFSPEMQAARRKSWVIEPGDDLGGGQKASGYNFGAAWSDPRTYLSGIVESLPEMVLTMGPAGRLAKGAYSLAIARGATRAQAARRAAKVATVAGGVTEGLFGGAHSATEVRDEIDGMTPEQLKNSDAVQTMMREGMSFEEARSALAEDAATQAFVLSGTVTGLFGGFGDRALAKIITNPVKSRIKSAATGAVAEGLLEELPQSVGQQVSQNAAMREADPERPLLRGAVNAGVGGAVVGSIMGGVIGGAAPHVDATDDPAIEDASAVTAPVADPPSGPLGRAMTRAPAPPPAAVTDVPLPRDPDAPLKPLTLIAGGSEYPVSLVGETEDAVWVKSEGGDELQIPRSEIDAGSVQLIDPATVKDNVTVAVPDDVTPDLTAEAPATVEESSKVEASSPAQPMSGASLAQLGDMADGTVPATPAPAVEATPPASTLDGLTEDQLRDRLRYLSEQARTNAGWSKPLLAEKKRVTAAIDAITAPVKDGRAAIAAAEAEAATSPLNDRPQPTDAQKEAGNYKLGHVSIGGLDISIENPAGTSRRPEWPPLKHSYGYVKRSEGADGDHVDVFLGPKAADPSNPVFIVDQVNEDGSFDEHKVMVGFKDQASARRGYLANYAKGWKGLGAITEMPFDQFREWAGDPANTTKPAALPAMPVEQVASDAPTPDSVKARRAANAKREAARAILERMQADGRASAGIGAGYSYSFGQRLPSMTGKQMTPGRAHVEFTDEPGVVHSFKVADLTATQTEKPDEIPSAQRGATPEITEGFAANRAVMGTFKKGDAVEYDHDSFYRDGRSRTFTGVVDGISDKDQGVVRVIRDGGGDVYVQARHLRKSTAPEPAPPAPETSRKAATVAAAERLSTAMQDAVDGAPADAVTVVAVDASPPPFAANTLFTADKVEAARARLKEKMGRLNSGIDPEVLIDGITITGAYIEAGVRKFADYAKAMRDDFGQRITPYLLSFWEGARNYPGLDTAGMSTPEESRAHHAELLGEGMAAEEATALGTEIARAPKKNVAKGSARTLRDDWGVEHIDGRTPIPGGKNEETDEGVRGGVKDAFLADAVAYLRATAAALRPLGFEPHPDRKGKEGNPVSKNPAGPAVSGDVSLTMRHPDRGVNVYVTIGATSMRGAVPTTKAGVSLMYRVSTKEGDKFATSGVNRWAPVDLSALDLADTIVWEVDKNPPEIVRDHVGEPEPARQGGDRSGVPPVQARGGVGDDSAARSHSEDVAAEQPKNVGEPGITGPDAQAGVRGAGTDVAPSGRTDEGGLSGDRRPRDGGTRGTAARPGNRRAGPELDLFSDTGSTVENSSSPAAPTSTAQPAPSPARAGPGNFHVANPLDIVGGGPVARFDRNRQAIDTFNAIRDDGRAATADEQRTLAGYTGWGSFGQELFQGTWERPMPREGWQARDAWLRDHMGRAEWESAQRSITNAHYTDPPTVMAMWAMMRRMGFKGGRVLEPSMGIGNFFGMAPADIAGRSQLAGIEMDSLTGGMAQLLYPDANIRVMPYQESKTPDDFYDLVIGNWPFENTVIADRRYDRLSPYLHDYFFLKAVDQVRPGGIVMGITSSGTMDKKATGIRRELARKAELVAAFRLPSGAFKEYAGTNVVTDIIILKKRSEPASLVDKSGWIASVPYTTPNGEVFVNEYYSANPQHVIGKIDFGTGTTRGRPGLIVHRPDDMAEQLARIVTLVPERVYTPESRTQHISFVANHTADREGSLTKTKDGLFIVRGEHLAPAAEVRPFAVKNAQETGQRTDQLERLIDMRKAYAALIDAERGKGGDAERKALADSYKRFVGTHGSLSDSFGLGYLRKIEDPFYPALAALEIDGKPAAILSKSTTRAAPQIDNPSIGDAFVLERNQTVNPSLDAIAARANVTPEAAKAQLLASGAVFELPNGDVIPSDMYLSGNVREKLRQARAAVAEGMDHLQRNVDALAEVVPADVPYFKIEVQLGATWVSPAIYGDFVGHMLGMPDGKGVEVRYNGGRWTVRVDDRLKNRVEASSGWGTAEYSFQRLVNAAFSNQSVTIRRRDNEGGQYVDKTATEEVNGKIADMRTKFGEWLWSDPERRVAVEAEYNEVRNAFATPRFDGSFLRFEGMALSLGNGPFDLRKHQMDAIWRALVMRRSLNAHEVGTGKTFTMGGIAVESRRYGIARKPLILAHNANSKTVAAEIQQMYPAAKVLYIDNLSPDTIDVKMRQIANDDWDAVVVPHSLIDRFAFREDTLMDMAREEIAAIEEEAYAAADDDGVEIKDEMWEDPEQLAKLRSPTAKELVKMRQRIIENIRKQSHRASREGAIPFEDLGIDMLQVDEAHEFKKPPISTRMKMKGLNTQTSDRSIALSFMTRYVRAQNAGGNVHLFTGTPITNTLTEVFHMMRYIMQEEMQAAGVDQWDGWFGSFAREVMDVEQNAAAEYEAVTRLAGFINVPELRRMIGQYMDVVFAEDMPEMQPRRTRSGKTMADDLTEAERAELLNGRTENAKDRPYKRVINVTSDLTPQQKVIFEELRGYARAWRQMTGKERKEAMAAGSPESPIITEGLATKASFDVRLYDGEALAGKEGQAPDDPGSKSSRVVENVRAIYDSHPQATQVIFAEQGFSNRVTRSLGRDGDGKRMTRSMPTFSTIRDIVERLVASGIPRDEIAIVDGSTNKDKRKEIALKMNAAKIRVVIGSTATLGVGVNMQKNLRAMHHLDAPWMPGDLEQRNGRGQRQGNQWNTVEEYRYLTDRLDGRRWQVLAIKQRFITAFLKADDSARTIEGEAAADEQSDILQSFAEAAGDPRILIREKLRKQLDGVQRRERLHGQGVANALRQSRFMTTTVEEIRGELAEIDRRGTVATITGVVADNAGDGFSVTIDGTRYEKRKDADQAIDEWAAANMRIGDEPQAIGTFGDQELLIAWPSRDQHPSVRLEIDGHKFAGGSMQGLERSLRTFAPEVEQKRVRISEMEASIERMKALAAEPFHMTAELERFEKALADLEADIQFNPVPPPAWLRAGAPVDTDVMWNGTSFTVTGHRWTADGWFVLAQDDRGAVSIPYTEAKDAQGIALYQERPFEAPEVVDKNAKPATSAEAEDDAPPAHSIGGLAGGGFTSTDGLRAHLLESSVGTSVEALTVAGKLVLHENESTLPGQGARASEKRPAASNKRVEIIPAAPPPLGETFAQRRRKAGAVARRLFADTAVANSDSGRDIRITASSIKHSLDGVRSVDDLALALTIPDLLRAAVMVNTTPGRNGRPKHDFYAAARMADGSLRRVKIVVQERADGLLMYSQHVIERQVPVLEGDGGRSSPDGPPSTNSPGSGASSTAGTVTAGTPGATIDLGTLLHEIKDADGARVYRESRSRQVQALTTADGVIHLVADRLTSRTALPVLLHEMFHAGVRPLIGEAAWTSMLRRLAGMYRSAAAREINGGSMNSAFWRAALDRVDAAAVMPGQEVEEFAAYAIEHRAQAPVGIVEAIDRLIGAVKAWMVRRFGRQIGRITPAQLQSLALAALRSGVTAPRTDMTGGAFYSHVVPSEAEVDAVTPGFVANLVTKAMDGPMSVLGAVPLRPLLSEMGAGIPAAQEYLQLKQAMDTMREKWHARADAVAQPWLKFRMLHARENGALMDLMHEATLTGADPSKPFTSSLSKLDRKILAEGPGTDAYETAAEKRAADEGRKAAHARLVPQFEALSAEAQRLFRSVRDEYRALSDAFEQVLLENLSKALDIKFQQARRQYDAELYRIGKSGMAKAEADEAVAAAERELAKARTMQGWVKGARMTRLRHFFETHNLSGPYFPLARFGNFFVTVRDRASNEVVSFSRFESPRDQQKFAEAMRKEGHDVQVGALDDGGALRAQVDARFVTDIESILEGADVSDAVRDAVWQRWLESMPDMSIRKSRIHRKGTAGYSADALRAFGHHMFHGSHQLARLKYALDLDEAIAIGRDQAKTMRDPVRAGLLINELARRHQFIMNPKGGPLAQAVTSAAFVYFLAVSPAAALVNVSQTAMLGVPILAAYDGRPVGAARAAAELSKALGDFTAGRGKAGEARSLTADERRAMEDAYETGLIERTQSHDLAGVGETGVEYSPVRTKVMAAISWAFHHTERMNREVTFLAAYRMARRKGESYAMAVDSAADLTWKIHFDYQNTSRPRVMQGDTAKVLFVFRNFNVNMLWRLFRDAHQAVKGGSKADRREAIVQLAGTTGMMMLSAGIRGTWMFGIAMMLATFFFGDDAEDEFSQGVVDALGHRLGGMALNGVPGDVLRVDLSNRIGMPDLWFRSPDREMEGRQEFDYWALQILGAGVGALRNMWSGASLVREGEVYRGVESMLPKFAKDLMRSARYASEGARTIDGDPVMEDMSAADTFKQAMGFTPAELSERYDRNRSMKNREQRILDERRAILNDFDRVIRDGGDTADVEARMERYNEANPDYPIRVRSIRQSMRSREEMRERKLGGVYLNPKLAERLNEEAPELLYSDE